MRALPVVVALSTLAFGLAPARGNAPPPRAAAAPTPASPSRAAPPAKRASSLRPVPPGQKAKSSHAPFTDGECSICHQRNDPKDPGPTVKSGNALCLECHDDLSAAMKSRKVKHKAAVEACVNCHNPHDSREPALLLEEPMALCLGCHEPIKKLVVGAPVKHEAMTQGKRCSGCHNPHASDVESLLRRLAFDLCVDCHGSDRVRDDKGRPLQNIRTLLSRNPVHHGPIGNKDCTACHQPHGGGNFRLLINTYPPDFYASYAKSVYALCFECHNDQLAAVERSTTVTKFRDGDRNLHYLHVNKSDRGRTCRACHEAHASKQPFQIRDAVPYGARGWMLRVVYKQTASGGSCDKTCHAAKAYDNSERKVAKKP